MESVNTVGIVIIGLLITLPILFSGNRHSTEFKATSAAADTFFILVILLFLGMIFVWPLIGMPPDLPNIYTGANVPPAR